MSCDNMAAVWGDSCAMSAVRLVMRKRDEPGHHAAAEPSPTRPPRGAVGSELVDVQRPPASAMRLRQRDVTLDGVDDEQGMGGESAGEWMMVVIARVRIERFVVVVVGRVGSVQIRE